MNPWRERPIEERALLNPAFVSMMVWHAARGHAQAAPMSIDVAFLVPAFVLDGETREALPRGVATSLATWLADNPISRSRLIGTARLLVPYSREALLFGSLHGLFDVRSGHVSPEASRIRAVNRVLKQSTSEVQACMQRALFVGRWFATAGSGATVMALVGVRP